MARAIQIVGVDVGGTFTDLIAWDGADLRVAKVASTPPDFHRGVINAVNRVVNPDAATEQDLRIIHGSTVATNALLQRRGQRVAFVTSEGFRDMLLIGRQHRPSLYTLEVRRPSPVTPPECWFTVRERIGAGGEVIESLDGGDIDRVIAQIRAAGLEHVAVCLLFSFINPTHERMIAERCRCAGLTVSLSSEVLPEFREYERASTTAINASLRPVVETYLTNLEHALGSDQIGSERRRPAGSAALRIMHSGGGTLTTTQASNHAARLILSGPAGGILGAAYIATLENTPNVITCDMGGTSTDVATILNGTPRRTTSTLIDGLPIGLPMFDIRTIGAGGGSIARLDPGGALRVGPQSAGADPGPACYGRGGTDPTVTDANVVLGRIPVHAFLGGAMKLDADAARSAIQPLAATMGKTIEQAAAGILTVAEANMASAVRAVTSRRGLDPRDLALLSFGGAGGLHACAIAEQLDIRRVIVPLFSGLLSALGMVVAPSVVDVSKTILHLRDQLDDDRLAAEFGSLSAQSIDEVPLEQTASVEPTADVRFRGQSHELNVRVERPSIETIRRAFIADYQREYGSVPDRGNVGRDIEIVTLRLRRTGRRTEIVLPEITGQAPSESAIEFIDRDGRRRSASTLNRAALGEGRAGPLLILDPEATTFVPTGWVARISRHGSIVMEKLSAGGQ